MLIPTFNDGESFGVIRAGSLNPVIEAVNVLSEKVVDLENYSNLYVEEYGSSKYLEVKRETVYLAGDTVAAMSAVQITDPSIHPHSAIPVKDGAFIHGVALQGASAAESFVATITGVYKHADYPIEGFPEIPIGSGIHPTTTPGALVWVDSEGLLSFSHEPSRRLKPIGYKVDSDYYYLDADFANGYQSSGAELLDNSLGAFPYELEVLKVIERQMTSEDFYIHKHYLAKGGSETASEITFPALEVFLGHFWFEGVNDEAKGKVPPATAFVFDVSLDTLECKSLFVRSVDPRLNIKGMFAIKSSTKDRVTRFSFVRGTDQGLGDKGWYIEFVPDNGISWVEASGEIPSGEVPVAHWWCESSPVLEADIVEAIIAVQGDTLSSRTLGLGAKSLPDTTFALERPTTEAKYTFFAHPSNFFEDSEGNKLEPTLVNTGAGNSKDWTIAAVTVNEVLWRTYTSPEKNLAPELHSCKLIQSGVFN